MQQELFREFEAQKRKRKKKFPEGILPKNYVLFNVSYEQVIFITIAVIMLMALIFSLGVERGKQLSRAPMKRERIKVVKTAPAEKAEPVTVKEEPQPETAPAEKPKAAAEEKTPGAKNYTVQLVAFRSKRLAQKELIKLGKKGYKPFIIVGGGYYQICVGEYENKPEAKEDHAELKKYYKESFIRQR
jgi:cell division septation protein DedD